MSDERPHGAALLGEPAQRSVRLIALDLLDDVRSARERLDDADDDEALHDFRVALRRLRSWLRAFRACLGDTVKRKVERRLRDLARSTNDSRDLEVHADWVRKERRTLSPSARSGATWLLARLRREKIAADLALRAAIDDDFDATVERVHQALVCYEASVFENPTFAGVIADLIEARAAECRALLAPALANGDRVEVHAARIWAKRVRYLLEPVSNETPGASATIDELKGLQDAFGALHDAQLFGSAIAAQVTEAVAARSARSRRAARTAGSAARSAAAAKPSNPVPGLRVLSRRLQRTAAGCVESISHRWNDPGATALAARIAALAPELRARSVERDAPSSTLSDQRSTPNGK